MNGKHPWMTEGQLRKKQQFQRLILALFILTLLAVLIALNTGYIRISPWDVLKTLLGRGTDQQELILFEFRLPRMVLAFLVGMGLAVAGAVLQGIARNPLADPGIIGISAGASLAVLLSIFFFSSAAVAPVYLMPMLAFAGAGAAALLIYALAYRRRDGIAPIRLILTGVAIDLGIRALIIVLTLTLAPENYQFMAVWLAGNIWGGSWTFVLALLPWLAVLVPFVYWKAPVLNVLNVGEETATGLGVRLGRERRLLLGAAVGIAAASVSVSGGIGFVGLIAPHLTRRLVGDRHEHVLPVAALIGGLLLLIADSVARVLTQPAKIPAGVVVAVIGAPYFLYLLAKLRD